MLLSSGETLVFGRLMFTDQIRAFRVQSDRTMNRQCTLLTIPFAYFDFRRVGNERQMAMAVQNRLAVLFRLEAT